VAGTGALQGGVAGCAVGCLWGGGVTYTFAPNNNGIANRVEPGEGDYALEGRALRCSTEQDVQPPVGDRVSFLAPPASDPGAHGVRDIGCC
jgi:hypothetical protein